MVKKLFYLLSGALLGLLLSSSAYGVNACDECKHKVQQNYQGQDFTNINDSAGLSYWEIKNETNHRTVAVTSDREVVNIEPGETKKVFRTKNFKFTVGYSEKYGDKKSLQTFNIDDHALSIYSRYFGKQSKLQFLIGITKRSALIKK